MRRSIHQCIITAILSAVFACTLTPCLADQYYIQSGSQITTVPDGNPNAVAAKEWHVQLFRQGRSQDSDNEWGLIVGKSAADVMSQLDKNQKQESECDALSHTSRQDGWMTYYNYRGPIAISGDATDMDNVGLGSRWGDVMHALTAGAETYERAKKQFYVLGAAVGVVRPSDISTEGELRDPLIEKLNEKLGDNDSIPGLKNVGTTLLAYGKQLGDVLEQLKYLRSSLAGIDGVALSRMEDNMTQLSQDQVTLSSELGGLSLPSLEPEPVHTTQEDSDAQAGSGNTPLPVSQLVNALNYQGTYTNAVYVNSSYNSPVDYVETTTYSYTAHVLGGSRIELVDAEHSSNPKYPCASKTSTVTYDFDCADLPRDTTFFGDGSANSFNAVNFDVLCVGSSKSAGGDCGGGSGEIDLGLNEGPGPTPSNVNIEVVCNSSDQATNFANLLNAAAVASIRTRDSSRSTRTTNSERSAGGEKVSAANLRRQQQATARREKRNAHIQNILDSVQKLTDAVRQSPMPVTLLVHSPHIQHLASLGKLPSLGVTTASLTKASGGEVGRHVASSGLDDSANSQAAAQARANAQRLADEQAQQARDQAAKLADAQQQLAALQAVIAGLQTQITAANQQIASITSQESDLHDAESKLNDDMSQMSSGATTAQSNAQYDQSQVQYYASQVQTYQNEYNMLAAANGSTWAASAGIALNQGFETNYEQKVQQDNQTAQNDQQQSASDQSQISSDDAQLQNLDSQIANERITVQSLQSQLTDKQSQFAQTQQTIMSISTQAAPPTAPIASLTPDVSQDRSLVMPPKTHVRRALTAAQQQAANARLFALWTDQNGHISPQMAKSMSIDSVRDALDAGADVNAKDPNGGIAIVTASCAGNAGVVKLLLDAGADPNATQGTGGNALVNAVYAKNAEIVKLLIDAGANKDANDPVSGGTPLLVALWQGYPDIAKLLIDAGANEDAKDQFGNTPLILAAMRGQADIAVDIMNARADKEATDNYGNTALVHAVTAGQCDMVKVLVGAGEDVNAKTSAGVSALQWAVTMKNAVCVQALITAGADVDSKNMALRFAIVEGATDIESILQAAGATN